MDELTHIALDGATLGLMVALYLRVGKVIEEDVRTSRAYVDQLAKELDRHIDLNVQMAKLLRGEEEL